MFQYYNPVKILFGENVSARLPEIVKEGNYRRIILFSRQRDKLPASVREILSEIDGRIVLTVDNITPEPTTEDIDNAAEKIGRQDFDAVVALGGGSVLDTAKATMAVSCNHCTAEDLVLGRKEFINARPLIAIPTTSGTGSEVTRAAALTYRGKKQPIFDNSLFARVALVDPVLTHSCPPRITASCGFDVLCHATESLMNKNANPLSVELALSAIRLCLDNLEMCFRNGGDARARSGMSEASLKAGLAISVSGCSAAHACSYMLSTHYRVPHGEACGYTLDKLIRLCLQQDDRFRLYARRLGFDDGESFADTVAALRERLGLLSSLEKLGVTEEGRRALAKAGAESKILQNHYFPLTEKDVDLLFEDYR